MEQGMAAALAETRVEEEQVGTVVEVEEEKAGTEVEEEEVGTGIEEKEGAKEEVGAAVEEEGRSRGLSFDISFSTLAMSRGSPPALSAA
jgi:hypothetical protein